MCPSSIPVRQSMKRPTFITRQLANHRPCLTIISQRQSYTSKRESFTCTVTLRKVNLTQEATITEGRGLWGDTIWGGMINPSKRRHRQLSFAATLEVKSLKRNVLFDPPSGATAKKRPYLSVLLDYYYIYIYLQPKDREQ